MSQPKPPLTYRVLKRRPWRRWRKKQFFCVGLAKCGTHTIRDMLAAACRTGHEPNAKELLDVMPRARAGEATIDEMRALFLRRQERRKFDFEANHLLSSFLPYLVEIFPEARFILLVRECRPWVDSMLNDQVNIREAHNGDMWLPLFREYFAAGDPSFPEPERALQELDLYPLSHYVRFWQEETRKVIDTVPSDRLLKLRTEDLDASVPEIADFFGISHRWLLVRRSHQSWRRHGLLDRIDPDYLSALLGPVPPARRLLGLESGPA